MNSRNFFAELKRRNVYKVAIAYAVIAWLLMQIATFHNSLKSTACSCVFDHVARSIVNANHSIV